MAKKLGLDLGTNSIGWAIVDNETNEILDSGVRIFPMGVVDINQGEDKEMSKNATRRVDRQTRRQFQRKRLRKVKLLEVLIENEMCPLDINELNKWWKWDNKQKTDGRKFPMTEAFVEWLKMNPYELRARGVEGDLSLMELGRVLYHMIQRRGFVSSRKDKDSGAIYDGKGEMKGINDTKQALKGRTLGQYLNDIKPKENKSFVYVHDENMESLRPRGRYTLRAMYVDEFERIWQKQERNLDLDRLKKEKKKVLFLNGAKDKNRNRKRIEYLRQSRDKVKVEEVILKQNDKSKILTKITSCELISLHDYLGGSIWYEVDSEGDKVVRFDNADSVLFYQRPLRSQKALLGKCRYEPTKTPVAISHPDFEIFRAWQFVNTIRSAGNQKLLIDQKIQFVNYILGQKKSFKFSALVKKFKLTFETFNYEDDKLVPGSPTNAYLKEIVSENVWSKYYDEIWHLFYFYTDSKRLFEKLKNTEKYELRAKVNLATIEKIIINSDKYASLSLKAIQNILPFLEMGYDYNEAVLLGGVKNAFNYETGDDIIPRWERFSESHEEIISNVIRINREKGNKEGEAIEKIKNYLSDTDNKFGFSEKSKAFNKLYHHSQEIEKQELTDRISQIENLRNPVVQRSVQEMRRLVNKLMETHGRFDVIAVEMGRELKQNKKRRQETQFNIRDKEKDNLRAKEILTEYGLAHSRNNIQKYLLFEEIQNKAGRVSCPYTGKSLNISDVLGSENKVQVEHIIPRSKSQNDSFSNKTLCDAYFNQQKGELTPYEFYHKNSDPKMWGVDTWEAVEQRAYQLLPFNKAKRFCVRKKDWDETGFVSRQLNDDRYISKKTKEVLTEVCEDVIVMPGAVTADLRRLWGLNNILQPNFEFSKQAYNYDYKKALPHWAVLNNADEIIQMFPQINQRPETMSVELCLTGFVKNQNFEIKQMQVNLDAETLDEGKYYAKVAIEGPKVLLKRYIDPPETAEDEITLRGSVSKNKFIHDALPKKINATVNDGYYYAKFKITGKNFQEPTKNNRPQNKNGIVLFGNVKEGVFSSFIFNCKTNLENGKYWALLNIDFEQVDFIPTENKKPNVADNELLLLGDVNSEQNFTPMADAAFNKPVDAEPGRYWAVFEIKNRQPEFYPLENPEPKIEKDERLIEGRVWVDQDEIRFDPKKNRDDHRHHAVDAIVIALTERNVINQINRFNAQEDEKRRNNYHEKPSFPMPWEGFRNDVQQQIDNILVSHHRDNPVLKKVKMKVHKNGKTYTSEGYAVRGQLHKETIFGKRTAPKQKEGFHVRKSVSTLKENQYEKIVDERIRKIIIAAKVKEKVIQKEIDALKKQRTKAGSDEEVKIDSQIQALENKIRLLYTLPNKRGERVPIKKVRIRENLGNTEMLKPSKARNQYVNPRNNHHVLIYKDDEGNLQEEMVTLWQAVELQASAGSAYAPPAKANEMVCTLEENDMFLIGLTPQEFDEINWLTEQNRLSNYLYRLQKKSSMYYTFRHHLSANINDPKSEFSIRSFKAWQRSNPIKVKVSIDGKVYPFEK